MNAMGPKERYYALLARLAGGMPWLSNVREGPPIEIPRGYELVVVEVVVRRREKGHAPPPR